MGRHKMTHRHLGSHDDGLLGGHANRDVVKGVHIFLVLDLLVIQRLDAGS